MKNEKRKRKKKEERKKKKEKRRKKKKKEHLGFLASSKLICLPSCAIAMSLKATLSSSLFKDPLFVPSEAFQIYIDFFKFQ